MAEKSTNEGTIMLIQAKKLNGYKLDGLDGEIGKVKDLYFDDRHWTIRYLVADTGTWLVENQVLISPYALNNVEKLEEGVSVNLTRAQIEKSPPLAGHQPVSLQFEDDYHGYYGWPAYWNGSSVWGSSTYVERDPAKWREVTKPTNSRDRHLRSTLAVAGYHIQALDGGIGHIEDFIIDDENWTIRYLVVATANWWPGRKVLVSPLWIERVSWEESKVFINLSRQTIKESPEYSEEALLSREYEIGMHHHYDRKGYWIDELASV